MHRLQKPCEGLGCDVLCNRRIAGSKASISVELREVLVVDPRDCLGVQRAEALDLSGFLAQRCPRSIRRSGPSETAPQGCRRVYHRHLRGFLAATGLARPRAVADRLHEADELQLWAKVGGPRILDFDLARQQAAVQELDRMYFDEVTRDNQPLDLGLPRNG